MLCISAAYAIMRCLSRCVCVCHCLVPSILHLSHGFQCSPTLNRQPYEGRLPLTSWWRKSSNMTVGQSSLISLTYHCYDWHPGSRYGWTCKQLTSKVDEGITVSRLRWSILTQCATLQSGNPVSSFDLPWQQWSLLNRFCTEQAHCGAFRRKQWLTDTDLCPCGETQTMSHIVNSTQLNSTNHPKRKEWFTRGKKL